MATNPSWYQDRYCDDQFNTPECNYDGGDCCVKKTENWHNYCQVGILKLAIYIISLHLIILNSGMPMQRKGLQQAYQRGLGKW